MNAPPEPPPPGPQECVAEASGCFKGTTGKQPAADLARLDRHRRIWAIGLNVIAPGAGLVILRREWFGLAVAALFVLPAHAWVYGSYVDPTSLRSHVAFAGGVAAALVWIVAQFVTIVRARRVLGDRARQEIASIVHEASHALSGRRFAEAIDRLNVALRVNDESVELRIALARVLTVMGRFDQARTAWEIVLDLDVLGAHRAEAINALDRLPA